MNKQALIEAIAAQTGQTLKQTGEFLDSFIETVEQVVASGDKVVLAGFGTFDGISTASRLGRNPRTGAQVQIAAGRRPRFTPGIVFRRAVRGGEELSAGAMRRGGKHVHAALM